MCKLNFKRNRKKKYIYKQNKNFNNNSDDFNNKYYDI